MCPRLVLGLLVLRLLVLARLGAAAYYPDRGADCGTRPDIVGNAAYHRPSQCTARRPSHPFAAANRRPGLLLRQRAALALVLLFLRFVLHRLVGGCFRDGFWRWCVDLGRRPFRRLALVSTPGESQAPGVDPLPVTG